ncbi:MAG: hypothetical protein DRK00_10540 [Thermoprotei archaeon]|nr:MAG: hypothetical protein DRK00_10540 [Thermoprotei archaeon]
MSAHSLRGAPDVHELKIIGALSLGCPLRGNAAEGSWRRLKREGLSRLLVRRYSPYSTCRLRSYRAL